MSAISKILDIQDDGLPDDFVISHQFWSALPSVGDFRKARKELARLQRIAEAAEKANLTGAADILDRVGEQINAKYLRELHAALED